MADDSRIELQLRALNGEDVVVPYPQSRVEKLLYKMNGYDIELDPPQSRVEELLKEYIDNGGGGGGSSDFSDINVTFINSDGLNSSSYNVFYFILDDYYGITSQMVATVGGSNPEVTVPLLAYKGKITLDLYVHFENVNDYISPVVTGDIAYDDGEFIITGTGTITLKPLNIS